MLGMLLSVLVGYMEKIMTRDELKKALWWETKVVKDASYEESLLLDLLMEAYDLGYVKAYEEIR